MIDYGLTVGLGPIDEIDADTLRLWRNNYRIYRYCRQTDLLAKESHLEWYQSVTRESDATKMYSVVKRSDHNVVGVAGLTELDLLNRRAEFSLYIAPSCQNMGYGKAALKTLVSHGFNTYGLETIWGESYEHNPGRHLFPKVGFSEDGIRRSFYYREGKFIDAYLYSILRREWKTFEGFEGLRDQRCST